MTHQLKCAQVSNVVLVMSEHGEPSSGGCSIVHTGAIQVAHAPEPGQLVQQQHLIQQLQQHIGKQNQLSSQDLRQLLTQVRRLSMLCGTACAILPVCFVTVCWVLLSCADHAMPSLGAVYPTSCLLCHAVQCSALPA